ncbi:hypothetical protein CsSME_00030111 [Camellia sinensis var. sinensis]
MQEHLYYHHTFIQNLLWNSIHYLSEPIMNSIQKIVKYMRYGAESSRYITIGCVEKASNTNKIKWVIGFETLQIGSSLQMMCWWVENPDGNEFKHHLARIPDYLWLAEDGMKMLSIGSQIWDTTLATQAIIASNMADEYGNSLRKAHDFESMYCYFTKGAWTFSNQDQGWVVADCTAESVKCLLTISQMPTEIAGKKANNESVYDAVNVLLFLQSPESGGFAIW